MIIIERQDGEGDADDNGALQYQRLVPRNEDLPIYSLAEFNEKVGIVVWGAAFPSPLKYSVRTFGSIALPPFALARKVLNGQSWLLVDDAILDVPEFAARHPGGWRLIINAPGTDVTDELLGEDMSVGHAMSFSPNVHSEVSQIVVFVVRAWTILKRLVIDYIDEDDEQEEDDGSENVDGGKPSSAGRKPAEKKFTIAGQSALFIGTRGSIRPVFSGDALPPRRVLPKRSTSDSGRSLDRFHVCPLLFREMMGAVSAFGRGYLPTSRPVYRYMFLCPGRAQILAQSITTGVCYFNMRAQEKGHV
ncbi:unnamed protein product [Ectocarpus sp. CCAP 1310/34]|nr:unnamed protein product [Ectocarpus sp. CCAP 1310/34]